MISDLPPVEKIKLYKYQGGYFYLYIDNGDKVLEDISLYTAIDLQVLNKDNLVIFPVLNIANGRINKVLPVTLTSPYSPRDKEISVTPLNGPLPRSYTLQFGSNYLTVDGDMLENTPIASDSIKVPVIPKNITIPSGTSAELGSIRIFIPETDRQQPWDRENYRIVAAKLGLDTECWLTGTIELSTHGDNCNA